MKIKILVLLCALASIPLIAEEHGAEAPAVVVNSLDEAGSSGGAGGPSADGTTRFQRVMDAQDAHPTGAGLQSVAYRGVMLGGGMDKDAPWETLRDWGVTLVRHQIMLRGEGPATNRAAYATAWRANFAKALDALEAVLVQARRRGIKVCIDMHSWPGGSCSKNDGDPEELGNDTRMFHDQFYADLFVECWTNIVRRVLPYRDVIYGYDLVNEPRQEKPAPEGLDLHAIQMRAARAIREIDPDTPIIAGSMHNDPGWFRKLEALDIDNVIYEVHVYYPHDYTHQGILTPLDRVEYWPNPTKGWDAGFLRKSLASVLDFQRRHGVKVFVGEFSAIAWAPGAETYIRDCIALFEEYGWDWTYHAFREYPGWSVESEAVSRGTDPKNYRKSASNPRMRMLKRGLAGKIAPEEAGAPCRTRTFRRVMFCGNSLTCHGPNADIGWTNNWGMAASAPERDYVHLLVRALEARSSVRPEFTIQTIPLEQGYDNAEKLSSAIGKAVEWQPDLVVLAYGENAHSVTNDVNEALCRAAYLETTRALRDAGAEVVLRAPFWPSGRFRRILSGVAEETGAIYVDIGDLGNREEMTAKGLFKHGGVAMHPGDAGMIAIADRILAAIVEHLEAEGDDSVAGCLEPAK